jgi:transposase
MSRPYSNDLRLRVVAVLGEGMTIRTAGALFKVSPATVSRWGSLARRTGSVAPRRIGGDRRSRLVGERAWILRRVAETPDLTIAELRLELAERGLAVGVGTVWRFFAKEGLTFKKNPARQRTGPARRGRGPAGMAEAPAMA